MNNHQPNPPDSASSLSPEHEYIHGSPALEPLFRDLRRKHFDSKGQWAEIPVAGAKLFLAPVPLKLGGIPCRGFLPAFGWETRPFDQALTMTEKDVGTLLDGLVSHGGWDAAQLTSMLPSEAELLSRLAAKRGMGCLVAPFSIRVISGGQTHEQYMNGRTTSENKEWRRTLRKAEKRGIHYAYDLAWKDIFALFDVKTIQAAHGNDYTKTQEFIAFFEEFRTEMKRQNRMVEVGVMHEGKLVGFDLGFWNGKVLHTYQTAYHPAYRDDRPGALVFERIIEVGLNAQATLIDFMGDYPYMAHYSKQVLDLRKVTLFAPSLRGRAAWGLIRLKKRLGR